MRRRKRQSGTLDSEKSNQFSCAQVRTRTTEGYVLEPPHHSGRTSGLLPRCVSLRVVEGGKSEGDEEDGENREDERIE